MTKRIKAFLLLLFLSGSFLLTANDKMVYYGSGETYHDVFSNKTIHIQRAYKPENLNHTHFKRVPMAGILEVNEADGVKKEAINDLLAEFRAGLLADDSLLNRHYETAGKQKKVYTSYNRDDEDYFYPKIRLEEIALIPLSYLDNKVYFKVEYHCGIGDYPGNSVDISVISSDYYCLDLKKKQIEPVKPELNPGQKSYLLQEIARLISKNNPPEEIAEETDEDEDYMEEDWEDWDYYEDEKPKVWSEKEILNTIQIEEAQLYPFAWGIVVSFDEYSQSSKIKNGNKLDFFMPLDEHRDFIQSIKPFRFIKNIKMPETTIQNYHPDNINKLIRKLKPSEFHFLSYNRLEKTPKKVIIHREEENSLFPDTIEFTKQGEVYRKAIYNPYNSEAPRYSVSQPEREYDAEGNIIRSKEGSYTTTYLYGKNNNLVEMTSRYDDEVNKKHYFYNGNFIYVLSLPELPDEIKASDLTVNKESEDEICQGGTCYLLDEHKNIKVVSYSNYSFSFEQIGRNEKGQIVEIYRDNYSYYLDYDEQGRLISYSFLDGGVQIKSNYTFYYTADSTLPYKQEYIQNNNNQQGTKTVFYEWENYE